MITCTEVAFYTDGSKMTEANYNGLAIFSQDLDLEKKYKIYKNTSIFTTEATAILKTLDWIMIIEIKSAVILTDSKSVMEAISNYNSPLKSKNTNYLIVEIKKKIKLINEKGYYLKICKVPAHFDIHGNEQADQLAKDATSSGILSEVKIPYTDQYKHIALQDHSKKIFLKNLIFAVSSQLF